MRATAGETETVDGRRGQPANEAAPAAPSSPLWHGLGLFGESYLLFSVGTLRPFWEALYPSCFDPSDLTACPNPRFGYGAMAYAVVLGVMGGMVALGALANRIGRRRGSISTAALMAAGAACLTCASFFLAGNPDVLFPCMAGSLFLFGVGVGGEYPLSASSASERAMAKGEERRARDAERERRGGGGVGGDGGGTAKNVDEEDDRAASLLKDSATGESRPWQTLGSDGDAPGCSVEEVLADDDSKERTLGSERRTGGRDVILVFAMQGMGIFANSLLLTLLLAVTKNDNGGNGNNYNDNDYNDNDYDYDSYYDGGDGEYHSPATLLLIWRISYATGAAVLIYVLTSRIARLTESEVWAKDREWREEEQREDEGRRRAAAVGGFVPPPSAAASAAAKGREPRDGSTVERFEIEGKEGAGDEGAGEGGGILPPSSSSSSSSWREASLLLEHYGMRLFGTSATWLLWDVAFYGNKLFQSSFLIALVGEDATLIDVTCGEFGYRSVEGRIFPDRRKEPASAFFPFRKSDRPMRDFARLSTAETRSASAVNAFVALLGYYAAAAIVDHPACGRLKLQQTGFAVTGTLFLLCGLLKGRTSSTTLVLMYFGSSFFGQCGPNCTTFLVPAEVFPTSARTACHGMSACAGKAGALIASMLFDRLGDERDLFLISGYASFVAGVVTFATIPETTTMDLYEIDKQWHGILRGEGYEGPATDPKHLSFYERRRRRAQRRG
ncbi:hypothetical protein ACHAWF_009639 [Thalassiosira exigua]